MKRIAVICAALVICVGGVWLLRGSGARGGDPPPSPSPSRGTTVADRSAARRRPPPHLPPPARPRTSSTPGAASGPAGGPGAEAAPPPGAPGLRVDLRPGARDLPGLDGAATDRGPIVQRTPSAYGQEMAEARAAVSRGDLVAAHGVARKVAAAEPGNAGARLLAASTACDLGDRDYLADAWDTLVPQERLVVERRCREAGITLDVTPSVPPAGDQ